jgi:RNA polymerase sigma-70 factor (ECF subfamily)
LQGWLYRVAHNLAMDWFRRESKTAHWTLDERLVAEGDSPSTAVEKLQTQQQLRVAIGQLTPDQQQVILLRFGEGLRIAEVSQLMGKSEGAVKIMQHRAIKRLRKLLEAKGK